MVEHVIYSIIPTFIRIHIKAKAIELITYSIEPETVFFQYEKKNKNYLKKLFLENVQCLECYPTLHKVPNNANNLHYSDHLAVCALFEIDEKISTKEISHQESLDNETCDALRSACILIEESIQRIQRHRYYCFLIIFSLFFILFSFNSLHFIFILCKNFVCLIGLAFSIWFLGFGKPVERNALQSIQNAIRLRLRVLDYSSS